MMLGGGRNVLCEPDVASTEWFEGGNFSQLQITAYVGEGATYL